MPSDGCLLHQSSRITHPLPKIIQEVTIDFNRSHRSGLWDANICNLCYVRKKRRWEKCCWNPVAIKRVAWKWRLLYCFFLFFFKAWTSIQIQLDTGTTVQHTPQLILRCHVLKQCWRESLLIWWQRAQAALQIGCLHHETNICVVKHSLAAQHT